MTDLASNAPSSVDHPSAAPASSQRPALSVVIPAYNEAQRIGRTLGEVCHYLARAGVACEIIVVDDGSTDDTADLVRRFAQATKPRNQEATKDTEPRPSSVAPEVQSSALRPHSSVLSTRLLCNGVNRGKGYSVRRGMLAATGDLVLMCDADLSTPIEEIEKLRPWLDRGYDVVIASRDLPEAVLDPPQPLLRRWMAWLFRAIRRRMLLRELRDTQCGFKLFRQPVARDVFARQTVDGWLFDCEVLGLADRLGYRIKEVGVVWRHAPHSRVKPHREALGALRTLVAIRQRLAEKQ
jgi:dolichyl-phosphate beta-glucosyltransferase